METLADLPVLLMACVPIVFAMICIFAVAVRVSCC